jgi:hypothetical protein
MKLDRMLGVLAALVFVTGCGARAGRPVSAPPSAVSNAVHLMSAELRDADDAPKVGKSQHSDSSVVDEEEGKKEPPHGRHRRGGFSGYK